VDQSLKGQAQSSKLKVRSSKLKKSSRLQAQWYWKGFSAGGNGWEFVPFLRVFAVFRGYFSGR
jgi:hypothetical protein